MHARIARYCRNKPEVLRAVSDNLRHLLRKQNDILQAGSEAVPECQEKLPVALRKEDKVFPVAGWKNKFLKYRKSGGFGKKASSGGFFPFLRHNVPESHKIRTDLPEENFQEKHCQQKLKDFPVSAMYNADSGYF